jgi:heme O synthase-like polyprenyltransferase
LYISVQAARSKTIPDARNLLKASVLYLPILYIVMVVNS